ncbi:MAG: hypothetical protein ACYC6Y_19910, partial [Thermoguttaceae bacterium]
MTPSSKVRIVLASCLLAIAGCSGLPPRGGAAGEVASLVPESMDLASAEPVRETAPPGPGSSAIPPQPTVTPAASMAPEPAGMPDRPATPSAPAPRLEPVKAELLLPMAEISAFVQELQTTPTIDAETRTQILTTLFQTPAEVQPQLIRQYRALLALGQATAVASAPVAATPAPSPAAAQAAPVREGAAETKQEAVVAASHIEPTPRHAESSETVLPIAAVGTGQL